MYMTTFSIAKATIQANEAELTRNNRMADRYLVANTRKAGISLDKLGDSLIATGKMLKGKLAPSY